jgi:CDGSH-type Zn-finger protein
MTDVVIEVLENGPFIVEGPVKVIDHKGNEVPQPQGKPFIKLCRCGGSLEKPFCDGTHSEIGFRGANKAVQESEK